ncbi:uncharacterized protein K452DRAFT_74134 [Aplosporella prunicola CBS 121167]|uniref:Uncharacterized protein n=1 Tax=Aplosporella prunicola CBS 121167 TaxID=1176127 RepID=A0A6A6B8N2_9PEZI|nr:uncharacterized protein K452DRAFT_74134 [Aplosporella prunicola CBS 121167]KAF2139247.1 hypothetical protein K452DRAFT_74134 [Aplosporella prunicola CBS 121167]
MREDIHSSVVNSALHTSASDTPTHPWPRMECSSTAQHSTHASSRRLHHTTRNNPRASPNPPLILEYEPPQAHPCRAQAPAQPQNRVSTVLSSLSPTKRNETNKPQTAPARRHPRIRRRRQGAASPNGPNPLAPPHRGKTRLTTQIPTTTAKKRKKVCSHCYSSSGNAGVGGYLPTLLYRTYPTAGSPVRLPG